MNKELLQNETERRCFKTIGDWMVKLSIRIEKKCINYLKGGAEEWASFYSGRKRKINCIIGKYSPLPKYSFPNIGF